MREREWEGGGSEAVNPAGDIVEPDETELPEVQKNDPRKRPRSSAKPPTVDPGAPGVDQEAPGAQVAPEPVLSFDMDGKKYTYKDKAELERDMRTMLGRTKKAAADLAELNRRAVAWQKHAEEIESRSKMPSTQAAQAPAVPSPGSPRDASQAAEAPEVVSRVLARLDWKTYEKLHSQGDSTAAQYAMAQDLISELVPIIEERLSSQTAPFVEERARTQTVQHLTGVIQTMSSWMRNGVTLYPEFADPNATREVLQLWKDMGNTFGLPPERMMTPEMLHTAVLHQRWLNAARGGVTPNGSPGNQPVSPEAVARRVTASLEQDASDSDGISDGGFGSSTIREQPESQPETAEQARGRAKRERSLFNKELGFSR